MGLAWRVLAVALLVGALEAHAAQRTPIPGTIVGVVVHDTSGAPLEGAVVRVQPLNLTTTTDEQGRFTIANVPPGTYGVTVSIVGFILVRRDVVCRATGSPACGGACRRTPRPWSHSNCLALGAASTT